MSLIGVLKLIVFSTLYLVVVRAQETGFFWQLTDLHYDPWYTTDPQSCNYNMSIRGKYGDFECDSPWELVKSTIMAMVDLNEGREADFILWSGDSPFHANNPDVLSRALVIEINQNITNMIMQYFPDKLVIPVLGNHDFYPKDQLSGDGNPIYDQFAEMWDSWLNDTEAKKTFKKGAYFTLMINEDAKVRAVVLNTNLYLVRNDATANQPDPGGQFSWFDVVMNKARQDGERVHIFTHVPTGKIPEKPEGVSYLRSEQNDQLIAAFKKHCDITLGIYSAHSHHDTFKIFYDDNGQPQCSMFIAPSASPKLFRFDGGVTDTAHNPALRRYTFIKSTYELHNIEQYSLNLNRANGNHNKEWRYLYNFLATYRLSNISTPQLQILLNDMKEYASDNFHIYYDLNSVSTEHDVNGPCSCSCKSVHLCAIEYNHYDEFDQCNQDQVACHSNVNYISMVLILATYFIHKILL